MLPLKSRRPTQEFHPAARRSHRTSKLRGGHPAFRNFLPGNRVASTPRSPAGFDLCNSTVSSADAAALGSGLRNDGLTCAARDRRAARSMAPAIATPETRIEPAIQWSRSRALQPPQPRRAGLGSSQKPVLRKKVTIIRPNTLHPVFRATNPRIGRYFHRRDASTGPSNHLDGRRANSSNRAVADAHPAAELLLLPAPQKQQ